MAVFTYTLTAAVQKVNTNSLSLWCLCRHWRPRRPPELYGLGTETCWILHFPCFNSPEPLTGVDEPPTGGLGLSCINFLGGLSQVETHLTSKFC